MISRAASRSHMTPHLLTRRYSAAPAKPANYAFQPKGFEIHSQDLRDRIVKKKKEASVRFVLAAADSPVKGKQEREFWSFQQSLYPDLELHFKAVSNHTKKPLPDDQLAMKLEQLKQLSVELQAGELEAYLYDSAAGGIERFETEQLSQIYLMFKQLHAYDEMVEMMEWCPNKSFREIEHHLTEYGHANLKSSYFNPAKVIRIMKSVLAKNSQACDAHYALGLAHAHKSLAAKNVIKMRAKFVIDKSIIFTYFRCFNLEAADWGALAEKHFLSELCFSISSLERAYQLKPDPAIGYYLMGQYGEKGMHDEVVRVAKDIWSKHQTYLNQTNLFQDQIKAILFAGRLNSFL